MRRCCCNANQGNDDYNSGRSCCADCDHTYPWPAATYQIVVSGSAIHPLCSYDVEMGDCGEEASCEVEECVAWCACYEGNGGLTRKPFSGSQSFSGTFDFMFTDYENCEGAIAAPYQSSVTQLANGCPLSQTGDTCYVDVIGCAYRITNCDPPTLDYNVRLDISEVMLSVTTLRSAYCPPDPWGHVTCIEDVMTYTAWYRRRKSCEDLYLAEGEYVMVYHAAASGAACTANTSTSWPARCEGSFAGLPSVITVTRTS